MASGHANRANRPNTWLHRPATQREVLTCQPGAVHTWHISDKLRSRSKVWRQAINGPRVLRAALLVRSATGGSTAKLVNAALKRTPAPSWF